MRFMIILVSDLWLKRSYLMQEATWLGLPFQIPPLSIFIFKYKFYQNKIDGQSFMITS